MKNKRIKKIVLVSVLVIIIFAGAVYGLYLYENKKAKSIYFERYQECKNLSEKNPIRSAGGVNNLEELKFVVNCFENKGCYQPCGNVSESDYPGINFAEVFQKSGNQADSCVKRCYYPPEHFKISS